MIRSPRISSTGVSCTQKKKKHTHIYIYIYMQVFEHYCDVINISFNRIKVSNTYIDEHYILIHKNYVIIECISLIFSMY